jgi:starvation-inducible DNA-binding protein
MAAIATKTPLHKTHINIAEETRVQLVDQLNQVLAILIDLKLQVKQAHWNVKGMRFIALHELFDELATEVEAHIDVVAERATTLGGVALGTIDNVKQATILEVYPLMAVTGEDHLAALIDRYAATSNFIRECIDKAESQEDAGTTDLYTDLTRAFDLRLWFLEAHVQDKM